MKPITHIIERQVLDLTLDTNDEAQARQEAARSVLQERVQLMLEEVFTRLAGPDHILRLDRLDIDLGTLSAAGWEAELVERLREQVEEELRQYVHESPDGDAATVSKSVAQSRLEAFLVFLDTGSLPWWVTNAPLFDPDAVLLELIASEPEALRVALRSGYRPERARRLVAQVDPATVELLCTLLAPAHTSLFKHVLRAWRRLGEVNLPATGCQPPRPAQVQAAVLDVIFSSIPSAIITEARLHEALIRQMAKQGAAVDRLVYALALMPEAKAAALEASKAGPLIAWLRETTVLSSAQRAALKAESGETKEQDASPESEARFSKTKLETPKGEQQAVEDGTLPPPATPASAADPVPEREATEAPRLAPTSEAGKGDPDALEEPEATAVAQRAPAETEAERSSEQVLYETAEVPHLEGQTFYVTNAGLVLLWPFFGRFFKKMNLVEDCAFRSPALQQRAVLLTHYLGTGETEAPEQVLLLNKILCGWPPEATVPKAIDLTPEERDESLVLLEAVVTQWVALKNTSIAGLQQAFLQREGRLLKQPEAWTLKVDRTGYDVLLDRLPWSIAIVKQPWMPHPLYVEW